MKKHIGKISIVIMLLMITGLLTANLIMRSVQAAKINPKAQILSLADSLRGMVLSESRRAYGVVYYCDNNNGNDMNSGRSWKDSFKTLAAAMAASHAQIGSGGQATHRNTIYYMADAETVTLTKLARKTDIVGVGSMNSDKRPKIIGDHTIDSTDYAGCRFYNIEFKGTGSANEIMHVATQTGLEFHNCKFQGVTSTTDGLKLDVCTAFLVEDCIFYAEFSTAAINVIDGSTGIDICRIKNNRFIAVSVIGILWSEDEAVGCWITDNYIYSVGLPIDDNGDKCFVVNNRFFTDIDVDGQAEDTGWDFNRMKSSGNTIMGTGGSDVLVNTIPLVQESDV